MAIDKEGFHRLVSNYASLLRKSGAKRGDNILITINISINFYAMAVATIAIGKIAVPKTKKIYPIIETGQL